MALLPILLAFLLGCEDEITEFTWTAVPDTMLLYSIDQPQLNRLSAFNFHERTPVRIEASGAAAQWDVVLDRRGGQLVLLPPPALGLISEARVAKLTGMTYANVVEAPKDTLLYVATTPVPLDLTSVYVVRTDTRTTEFGGRCHYFAKMVPLTIDVAAGTLTFMYDTNPVCNDRRLVPPEAGT